MASYDKLIGKRFDKLVVIDYIPGTNGKRAMRKCKCDCGNECLKDDKYLNKNIRCSCGCHLNMKTKVCADCNLEKSKSDFHALKTKKTGVQSKCKECISVYKKKRYWDNRDESLAKLTKSRKKPENAEQRKGYYNKNKNEYTARYKKYMSDENKKANKSIVSKVYAKSEQGKNMAKKRYLERIDNDVWYLLKTRIQRRIRSAVVDLSKGVNIKRLRTMEYLGCTPEFFKQYFESKFTDGMCWERISEIHIDHIKPCRKFDLTDIKQQMECFNWKNLQPLWWIDNIKKADKYDAPY